MGHIGVKGLRAATEGSRFDDSTSEPCAVCAKANITRTPFPHQASHRATRLLERVHTDVCGPLPPGYNGFRYFILFICCHSRFIFLYLMRSKDEAPYHFANFRAAAETFSGQKIALLRADNAPELTKGTLETLCKTAGITYEKTIPDSPNQNGVAERCNRTLNSMVRALLIDSGLSQWFWPFAIQTAVHIKNRAPHSALPPTKTPFEMWYHHKPNLSHLRLFGSPCTARILSNALTKYDARGESGRFLGYAKDARGYIVWITNPNGRGGTAKVRRDVTFHSSLPDQPLPTSPHTGASPLWEDVPSSDQLVTHDKPEILKHAVHYRVEQPSHGPPLAPINSPSACVKLLHATTPR
jgi:transposase InsO family protein